MLKLFKKSISSNNTWTYKLTFYFFFISRFQVETIPTIRIVKSFDQNVVHVNDFTQLETSMSWHRFPIFVLFGNSTYFILTFFLIHKGNINKEISDYYVLVPIPIVYLWIKPDQVETLTPLITKLANEFKLNYNFVHIDW